MTNALDDTAKTYDYAAAKDVLRRDWATIPTENPEEFKLDYVGFMNAVAEHIYTLEYALETMQRMKDEDLLLVKRTSLETVYDFVTDAMMGLEAAQETGGNDGR
jgi:hypothetical protein